MLHVENPEVRDLLLCGNYGLEKEMLRITADGHLAHTPHPFSPEEASITRDFCENQVEINTPIFRSAEEVIANIRLHTDRVRATLDSLTPREILWQYSNPPYLMDETDVPIAQFEGTLAAKTSYRRYLSQRYGRYLMTLSGIHFNYSFSGDLLRKNYEAETGTAVTKGNEPSDYRAYQDRLYLGVAENLVAYGWLMTVLTAASPLSDTSYFVQGRAGSDLFCGMASLRCSELGYWNGFTPCFNYEDAESYVAGIERFVKQGLIAAPSELYYPIRLKPKGLNTLDGLRTKGVNHIELRMIDLNPLCAEGIDVRDVEFAKLLTVWAGTLAAPHQSMERQMMAVTNFKHAAHYDLHTTGIVTQDGKRKSLAHAALDVLGLLRAFYQSVDAPSAVMENIDYQTSKILHPEQYRYADIVCRRYAGRLVKDLVRDMAST